MKNTVVALFGFSILIGNFCLMNVSYAAGPFPSGMRAHASHRNMNVREIDHCAESMCTEPEVGNAERDAEEGTCTSGHCMRAGNGDRAASPSAALESADSGSHGFMDALITQALLIAGPRPAVDPFAEGNMLENILTVVMRE